MVSALDLLKQLVGRQLVRLSRIFYICSGQVERGTGPIEFEFEGGRIVHLKVGGDGESLVVEDRPWQDPFDDPISQENEEWIAEHGKWARFDVSGWPEFMNYIGRNLTSILPLYAFGGGLCGARLVFDDQVLDFAAVADEAYVFTGPGHDLRLASMEVIVRDEPESG
jgi:hypothetical protein